MKKLLSTLALSAVISSCGSESNSVSSLSGHQDSDLTGQRLNAVFGTATGTVLQLGSITRTGIQIKLNLSCGAELANLTYDVTAKEKSVHLSIAALEKTSADADKADCPSDHAVEEMIVVDGMYELDQVTLSFLDSDGMDLGKQHMGVTTVEASAIDASLEKHTLHVRVMANGCLDSIVLSKSFKKIADKKYELALSAVNVGHRGSLTARCIAAPMGFFDLKMPSDVKKLNQVKLKKVLTQY